MLEDSGETLGKYLGSAQIGAVKCLPFALILLSACRGALNPADYNPDWTAETHGQSPPNYSLVFPPDSVNRIDIIMTSAEWSTIRTDMTRLWGFDFGEKTNVFRPFPEEEAEYVDVLVRFNGREWKHVGFRLKGNATLQGSWNAGIYKLPFRLTFNEFENPHYETWNQRFYGFQQLTMANNGYDESLLRERTADEVFRRAGVPVARAAFYRVYIDFGQGLAYNGLYTMVEVIEDTMLPGQFGENAGNLYKPESRFQTFVASEFQRQNNKSSSDYSDVQEAINALNNNSLRTGNPAQWRASLEARFNVDDFLKYLAVNNAIQSQDSYGINAHNHYLYNHSSRKLTWIPWDQNAAFFAGGLSLTMVEVSDSWPLVRYLIDDPVYYERYRTHLRTFSNTVYTQAAIYGLVERYHNMIAPFVTGPNGEIPGHTFNVTGGEFTGGLQSIKDDFAIRRVELDAFLQGP